MTTAKPGTDAELDLILIAVYTCGRVWEAWRYGTMTADDFEDAAETGVRDDLIAWRDAAVAKALAGETEPAAPTLAERVTAALLAAGFRERADATVPITQPSFGITGTAGAEVEVALWWAALNDARGQALARYAAALRAAGFTVAEREGHLYVPELGRAVQETTTTAGENGQ